MFCRIILLFVLFCSSFYSWSYDLNCEKINSIQYQYLSKHVNQNQLSKKVKKRVIDQFIENLDNNKIYFIQPDVHQIKRWMSFIFEDLEKGECDNLVKIYNLFYERIRQRVQFAKNEISKKDFKMDKNISFILDSDKRSFAQNKSELDLLQKKYIHYELASIMTIEKDEAKAQKHLIGIYDRTKKKVYSWDPSPSKERLDYCKKQESKNKLVKICKKQRWYALYLDSFARALDPHSSYFSSYELDDFEINMQLSLEGIGASLSSRYGYITIERLLAGGAAKKSGLIKKKDKILAIGQKRNKLINIFGWDLRDVVEMVRGKKGTQVHLKILRELKNGKSKKMIITLVRDRIELEEGAVSVFFSTKNIRGKEQNIAVIRIPSFYGGSNPFDSKSRLVSKDLKKILKEVKRKKTKAVVLDLSGNGGGVLTEAVKVAGLFIKKGNIVRQMVKGFAQRSTYHTMEDEDGIVEYNGPLVVLVNRSSASASEIVAGALKNYKRAVVVGGDHTFGKGSIQSVENLPSGLGAIKVTVGLFFIPGGQSIQKMGVSSDIILPSVLDIDSYGEKNLDYVLPQQHITSFLTRVDNQNLSLVNKSLIRKLKMRSLARIQKNKKFKKIKKEIAEYKKELEEPDVISINKVLDSAQKRSEENQEQEEIDDLNIKDPEFQKEYLSRADVEEAVNIAWDMSLFQKSLRSSLVQN